MNPFSQHLSDDTLDDLLLGLPNAYGHAHIMDCPPCAARLEEFRTAVALFNQASATWSEARSNTISREIIPRNNWLGAVAGWSFGSVAVLVIALALTAQRDAPSTTPGTAFDQTTRQQEIASDNEMLGAIDSEISHSVPSPVEVYRITGRVGANTRRADLREVRE